MSVQNLQQPPTTEASSELETSVPTDLTISSFSDEDKNIGVNRELQLHFKDRRQFIHELQLLKIELSQKNSIINNLQSTIASNTENFEEKLSDAVHHRHLLEARLRAELKISEEEARHQNNILKSQFSKLEESKSLLAAKNYQQEDHLRTLNEVIENFSFSEGQFNKLRLQNKDAPNIVDRVLLKLHENIYSFKNENDELNNKLISYEQKERDQQKQISIFREAVEREREEHSELKERYNKLSASCRQAQSFVEHGNYAQENFDRVKNERDNLEKEVLNIKDENSRIKSSLLLIRQENNVEREECSLLKNKLALLQKECEHLEKQISDLTQRWGEAQDRAATIQLQLDHAKSSRVELMERFMQTKDKMMHDYEKTFKEEKEKIIESAKLSFEKEIRSSNEAKNTLLRQKQAAEMMANEYQLKYEKIHAEICQKDNLDSYQISSLGKELESKKSEILSLNSLIKQLHEALNEKNVEKNTLNLKIQGLEQELESLKKTSSQKTLELENELGDKRVRLEIYEKLDHEFDETIKSAAKAEDEKSDEILESVAAQLYMPSTSRFSISRCVNLTRKLIDLERKLHLMEKELQHLNTTNNELNQRLAKANELLDQVDQPYSYLISTVRSKEDHIQYLNQKLNDIIKQMELIKKEKEDILRINNELKADLNQVLTDEQELQKVKQILLTVNKSEFDDLQIDNDKSETKVKSVIKKAPEWYKKLTSDKR